MGMMNMPTGNEATEIRATFNAMIAASTDAEQRSRLELIREYATNPEFRKALEDHCWNATQD